MSKNVVADAAPVALGAAGMAIGGPFGAAIGSGVGSIVGGLFDNSEEEAMDELRRTQALYAGIQTPQFNNYVPVSYNAEQAQATTISEDPRVRSMQMDALMREAGLAQTGLSDVDNAGYAKAQQLGGQLASSGNAAALQNAEARGVGGSGLEFAMREKANQDAAERASQAGLTQAADSARMRAMYNQAFSNDLAQLRGQDLNASRANADILNNFSQYNTSARNQANLYNVGQQNYGQQYNNQLQQQNFSNQIQRANGQAGANQGMAGGYAAQGAANQSQRNSNASLINNVAMGLAGPSAPRYNTNTGQALYDPQTGKKYGE